MSTAGTYQIIARGKTDPKRGIFQLSISGVNRGTPQDEYSATTGYILRNLGSVKFSTIGNKALKFLVTGKNASSGGYSLTFDNVELIPSDRLEAESLALQAKTASPSGKFKAPELSGEYGSYFNSVAVGDYITYRVPVAKAGTYRVLVGLQTKPDKGIFQLTINSSLQGARQDEYSSTVRYGVRDLGTAYLNAGTQSFTFKVAGHNASSSGYTLDCDYIELIP